MSGKNAIRDIVLCGVTGVVAASLVVYTFDHDATIAPVETTPVIHEDEPGWNCLTMGNKVCGPSFVPVETATLGDGSPLLDVLTEGERQDWTGCLIQFGDTTYIVCPDGYVESS